MFVDFDRRFAILDKLLVDFDQDLHFNQCICYFDNSFFCFFLERTLKLITTPNNSSRHIEG